MIIERPNKIKLLIGIFCCFISAWVTNLILAPDPDSSNLFWIAPGLIFGFALLVPNIADIDGLSWKIISIVGFPILMVFIWGLNIFLALILCGTIQNLFRLKANSLFIGFCSSLTTLGAFNFFYQRKIKLLNYCIVGLFGYAAFVTIDTLYLMNGEGMTDHLDKLIYSWQIFVGIGISLSFRKENLKVFIKRQ